MNLNSIIIDSSLYAKWENNVKILDEDDEENDYTIDYLISNYEERVELYCAQCKSKRIFAPDKGVYKDSIHVVNQHYPNIKIENKPSLYKTFRCSASSAHFILFGFLVHDNEIIKVAEYPSKYEMVQDILNKYKHILPKEKISELAKASQLESYGYSIAAFLYYRRIFEIIIFKTFQNASITNKISEIDFRNRRMDDKLKYVDEYLPNYFKENSQMYGTLSKAVHELEEEECREYLPIVQAILFYSLDEAVDKRNHDLRKQELSKKLKDINTKIK